MIPSRLIRARQMAGLSIVQATRRLGWPTTQSLLDFETGDCEPSATSLAMLADLYGVSMLWLRGENPPLPESTLGVLRDVESTYDRAALTELLTATRCPMNPPTATVPSSLLSRIARLFQRRPVAVERCSRCGYQLDDRDQWRRIPRRLREPRVCTGFMNFAGPGQAPVVLCLRFRIESR